MKLLYDFFPILLFFIAYKTYDIFVATAVAIIASFIQIGIFWLKHKRFEKMHLISAAALLVLGGLTIILKDKAFIMWKPTIVYWIIGLIFLGTALITKKSVMERMANNDLKLPGHVWNKVNLAFVFCFILLGFLNIPFALNYLKAEDQLRAQVPNLSYQQLKNLECESEFPEEVFKLCNTARQKEKSWVNFKLFGSFGILIIFSIGISIFLYRYIDPDDHSDDTSKKDDSNNDKLEDTP